jgi:hypothetical protein
MKRRQALVSNSSSCSFLLIGFEIPKDKFRTEEIKDIASLANCEHISIVEDNNENPDNGYAPDGMCLVGVEHILYEGECSNWNIRRNINEAEEMAIGLGISKNKIRAWTGTGMC